MHRTLARTALAAAVCFPSAPAAQGVAARADVRVGCSVPAPSGSLRAATNGPTTYLPYPDGVVAMEVESAGALGDWVFETVLPGYSGAGYLRWDGPDLFGTPGVGVLTFPFVVESAQDFVFRLWSQQNGADTTLENDCWIRVDGGEWLKIFGFQNGIWNQNAVIEGTNDLLQEYLDVGVHTVELSGRSRHFNVDRVDAIPASIGWSEPSRPQSVGQGARPVLGSTFALELGDPTGSASFGPTAVAAIALGRTPTSGCGAVLPGFGELLADLPTLIDPFLLPWGGGTATTGTSFPVPTDTSLVGQTFTFQGALLEPVHVVLTDALDVTLGDV